LAPGNFGNCPSKPVFNGKKDFGEVIPIAFEPWEQAYNPEMCNECLWQKVEYISQIYDNGNPPTLRN
jgi:hypothetical protein